MPPLVARDLVRIHSGRRVLDGMSLTAAPGRRVGLIGENGAGKSTLLRLLAGDDEPDAGQIQRPDRVGFLRQEMPLEASATVKDVVDEALSEARADLAALESLSELIATPPDDGVYRAALTEYGQRLEQAEVSQVWDADRRAALVLEGLGLGGLARERSIGRLSGGQRGRLALAALLIRRPVGLLLDEPTNHLDDDAAEFLERQLLELPGAVVLASHDRAFLDAVCTDIIDMDPSPDGPVRHGGNYSSYVSFKAAERRRWEERYREEQDALTALRTAVSVSAHEVAPGRVRKDNEKMGYGHTAGRVQNQVARRVRDASRRLEALERSQVAEPPAPLRFAPPRLVDPEIEGVLIGLRHVSVPGRMRLDRLDIPAGGRLLVTGPNGSGKSTLLAVLAGRLEATGEVRRRAGVRVGLLAQDSTFDRLDLTAAQVYAAGVGLERAGHVPLDTFGLLSARDINTPLGHLSVGQRRRLALAMVLADPPDVLLLDEPTNHLSPLLSDELEEAWRTGPGAIVVASHDRRLRSRWRGPKLELQIPEQLPGAE